MDKKEAEVIEIAYEFARRAKRFHAGEEPMSIQLWGLFDWDEIDPLIQAGQVIPNPNYTKENKTIWCKPSQEFYDAQIKPLMELDLDTLTKGAGWYYQ